MSIKSLLQLILLFLILIIIGGIYFLYFYQGQNKISLSNIREVEKLDTNFKNAGGSFNENLLENTTEEEERSNISEDINTKNNKNINIDDKNFKKFDNLNVDNSKDNKKIKNFTREIEYITTNKKGDIFKILAKYGKTNLENNNLLDLETVNGTISSSERSTIYISSDYAKYNYDNQNSKFYKNVEIKYDDRIITCENFDLNLSENIAKAYSNVIVKDNKSVMKSQLIIMDIITKEIKINSNDKVKVLTK